jgi:choline dehydrogenase-like flavoprotein
VRLHCSSIASGTQLRGEVAVVGAGPAGIVTALELARRGHRVVLIDSGGDAFDAGAQTLGDTAGEDPLHAPMALATRRQLGGASNLWGGRCVPFDPIDFRPRKIVGEARWPIDFDDVERYFQRACDWCVCGEAVFDARRIAPLAARSLVPGFPDGRIGASSLERWSLPTNFARQYRTEIEQSERVTLVTGLTCTEVACEKSGDRVDCLRARSLAGGEVTVKASRYVLACGGLETTRLLFASNRHHREGIGNHSGHLGRWYMAHVESRIAEVHFRTPASETIYAHERDADGVYVRRRMTLSADLQLAQRLPNAAIWLVNPQISDASHGSGVLSFVYLMLASPLGARFVAEGIRQAHLKANGRVSLMRHVVNVVRDLPRAASFAIAFGYKRYVKRGRHVPGFFVPSASNVYPLMYHGEHLPNRDSRVEPTDVLDDLGVPRLRTHLAFGEADVDGVIRAHEQLDEYLREHDLGRLVYRYDDLPTAVREQLSGGYHQAGTTRMSAAPQDGVVDRNLAVHGFADLFVASSSVFVTAGQANSTFTIIALALRLGDHLDAALQPAIREAERSLRRRRRERAKAL